MRIPWPVCVVGALLLLPSAHAMERGAVAVASSSASGYEPAGAIDGKRFATDKGTAWQGQPGARSWWWQVRLSEPRSIGALLQIHGGHPVVLPNAPKAY